MSVVYEVVRSRVRTGAQEEMLQLRPRMIAAVRQRFPELLDARLVEMDDGSWLDSCSEHRVRRPTAPRPPSMRSPRLPPWAGLVEEILSFEHGVDREPAAG